MSDDDRLSTPRDPEDAARELPTVDPDAPPAKPNADDPVPQDEPLKDQGDALEREKKPRPKGAEDIYGDTWIDSS